VAWDFSRSWRRMYPTMEAASAPARDGDRPSARKRRAQRQELTRRMEGRSALRPNAFPLSTIRSPTEVLDHRHTLIVATHREIATINSPTTHEAFGSGSTD
jgi:hypothetical protein